VFVCIGIERISVVEVINCYQWCWKFSRILGDWSRRVWIDR